MGPKEIIDLMLQIQEREFVNKEDPETSEGLAALRTEMPPQFAGHFDRFLQRGKRAIAAVINGTCKGCNMSVPAGTVLVLRKQSDIQLCGSCGRYLYLPPEVVPTISEAPPIKPRRKTAARKPRKAKVKEA